MINLRRAQEGTKIDEVSLALQGMNTYLAGTVDPEGNKSLLLRVAGVGVVVRITDSLTGSWTISVLAESSQGVGVLKQDAVSICVGPARNATEKDTTEK